MIEEALKYLVGLGQKAVGATELPVDDKRRKRLLIGGNVETIDLDPSPRQHKAGCLAEIIALANRFKDEGASPVVWYTADDVVLVLDDEGHRVETVTLNLVKSEVFLKLAGLAKSKEWFEPKPFIRLLRIDLAGTLSPGELLDRVRKIRFENGATVSAEKQHQKESLGREIIARVESAAGEIPEEVVLSAPLFSTMGETDRFGIRCSVEVDPMQGAFRLLPLPDELQRVTQIWLAGTRERLGEQLQAKVPAYYGKP